MIWTGATTVLSLPQIADLCSLCRVTQLEEEVGACRRHLQQAQSELAGKEADNVSLYEKIRYLQRYSSNRQASSSDGLLTVVQVDDAGVAKPQVWHCNLAYHRDCHGENLDSVLQVHAVMPRAPVPLFSSL